MKKVIFVGGTSFSGSTLLDMILANDPRGFSIGEVVALFNPYRSYHINPKCACGQEYCDLWNRVLKNGQKNLYKTVFELFPQVEFIVDSSKNPHWIASQTRNLTIQNLKVKNILIWKTPLEFAESLKKRNRIKDLRKSWINYHRLYFTLVNNWRSVRYFDLANDVKYLKDICEYLDIEYFKDKQKYWEKRHHTLFGNTSAKIHIYSDGTKQFEKAKDELLNQRGVASRCIDDKLKKVYYEKPSNDLEKSINDIIASNRYFSDIQNQLDSNDLHRSRQENELYHHNLPALRYNKIEIIIRMTKYNLIRYQNRRKFNSHRLSLLSG